MYVLGNRIRELRKSKKLSQEQLSSELNQQFGLNIDRVMISKWETGFQKPMINSIVCLAKYFNVSIDYLNGNEISSPLPDGNGLSNNDRLQKMIAIFSRMTQEQQDRLFDFLKSFERDK